MKHVLAIAAIFITSGLFAQSNNLMTNNTEQSFLSAKGSQASYGSSYHVKNPKRRVEGTQYLFDEWNNVALIHTNDKQRFLVRNVNLNLKRYVLESKIGNDSIFSFNFNNIEKFVINGSTFKNYYWNDDSRVYEIVYENDDFQLLKGFKVEFQEGSANPMLNRLTDKYIRREAYYIRKDEKIKPFKLRKKRILKLVDGNEVMAEKIENYAKNNKLSFSKEDDVQKILDYSAKN